MKKFFAVILTLTLALSLSAPVFAVPPVPPVSAEAPSPFTDCSDTTVIAAYELGIIHGTGNGKFRPLDTITRAEWAQMLYNAFREEPYIVPSMNWYDVPVHWLCDQIDQSLYDFDPNGSASYDWCIETAYQLWCRGGEIKFVATDATAWALGYGAGISDSWRNLSNMGAASGQFFTRTEAVALLIRLGELDLNV